MFCSCVSRIFPFPILFMLSFLLICFPPSVPGRSVPFCSLISQDFQSILVSIVASADAAGHAFIWMIVTSITAIATVVLAIADAVVVVATTADCETILAFVVACPTGNIVDASIAVAAVLVIAAIWMATVATAAIRVKLCSQTAIKWGTEGCINVITTTAGDAVTV